MRYFFNLRLGTVHLRVCGDNPLQTGQCRNSTGSPPRVRRQSSHKVHSFLSLRFTSACAETICPLSSLVDRSTVHLRVCGDNRKGVGQTLRLFGSPPRVRRQCIVVEFAEVITRFTSACAETISITRANKLSRSVHLRVCGDNFIVFSCALACAGSPPRVRRQSKSVLRYFASCRFTSACAETIADALPIMTARPVHLRVCGDNVNLRFITVIGCGSPPRVRRQSVDRFQLYRRIRFTSACAETIFANITSGRPHTVHLRVCGDNVV